MKHVTVLTLAVAACPYRTAADTVGEPLHPMPIRSIQFAKPHHLQNTNMITSSPANFTVTAGSMLRLKVLDGAIHTGWDSSICSTGTKIIQRHATLPATSTGGADGAAGLRPNSAPRAVRFTDVASAAGIRGRPQRNIRTSPNCLFDQWDAGSGTWNVGSFCIPEILTGGAAAGDANGDGWPDLYLTRLDAADSLYINNGGDGTFTDVTHDSGLGLTGHIKSNGVAFLDIDNDGDQDIFVSTLGASRMYLFVNDGHGHFAEEAVIRGADLSRPAHLAAGDGGLTSSFSIAVGDYDNDGWLDMYVTEWFPRLNAPPKWLDADEETRRRAADNDSTCKLLRNQGAVGKPGHFTDVTWKSGLRPKPSGRGIPDAGDHAVQHWWSDAVQADMRSRLTRLGVDNATADRRMLEANSEARAVFNRREQSRSLFDAKRQRWADGQLEAARATGRLPDSTAPGSGGSGAYDSLLPQHPSLTVSLSIDEVSRANRLRDNSHSAHLMSFPYVGLFQFGARFVDLNRDGLPELLISGDFGTTQLNWNNGDGTFSPGPLHIFYDHFDNSMGATIGDVDLDGWQDVLMTSMSISSAIEGAVDRFYPKAGISANFDGNHLYMNLGRPGAAHGAFPGLVNGSRGVTTTSQPAAAATPISTFREVSLQAGVKHTGWAWGAVLFDYDNNGWLDVVISNGMDDPETTDDDFAVNTPNAAFRNTGRFEGTQGIGCIPTRQDPYACATKRSHGNGVPGQPGVEHPFQPVASQLGLDDRRDGRGYLDLDYDGDGDLDLVLVNSGDYPALYRNDGGDQNSWIRFNVLEAGCFRLRQELDGCDQASSGSGCSAHTSPAYIETACATPRHSLGATIRLQGSPGSREVVKEVGSAAAFMAHSELTSHFGLGSSGRVSGGDGAPDVAPDTVHKVSIYWPARNATRIVYNLPALRTYNVRAPTVRDVVIVEDFAADDGSAVVDSDGGDSVVTDDAERRAIPSCSSSRLTINSVDAVVGARAGNATVAPDGRSILYTAPTTAALGATTTISYTMADGEGNVATGTASVLVVPKSAAPGSQVDGTSAPASDGLPVAHLPDPTGRGNHPSLPHLGAVNTPFGRLAMPHRAYAVQGTAAALPDGMGGVVTRHIGLDQRASAECERNFTQGGFREGHLDGPFCGLPPVMLPSPRLVSQRLFSLQPPAPSPSSSSSQQPQPSLLLPYLASFVMADLVHSHRLKDVKVYSGLFDDRDDNIAVPRGDGVFDPEASGTAALPFTRSLAVTGGVRAYGGLGGEGMVGPGEALRQLLPTASADRLNSGIDGLQGVSLRLQLNHNAHHLHLQQVYGSSPATSSHLFGLEGQLMMRYERGSVACDATAAANAGGAGITNPFCGNDTTLLPAILAGLYPPPQPSAQSPPGSSDAASPVASPPQLFRRALASTWLPSPPSSLFKRLPNPYNLPPSSLLFAGDARVNHDVGSVLFTTLFAREHNRVWASMLACLSSEKAAERRRVKAVMQVVTEALGGGNGTASARDPSVAEVLMHAAAALTRARYQAIVWYDLLPALVGRPLLDALPPYTDYSASTDPSITSEFGMLVPPVLNTMLQGSVARVAAVSGKASPADTSSSSSKQTSTKGKKSKSKSRTSASSSGIQHLPPIALRDTFFASQRLLASTSGDPNTADSSIDSLIRGLWSQPARPAGPWYHDDLRNGYLSHNSRGLDLAALDIQRDRDHGLPSYNAIRAAVGLQPVGSFDDLVLGNSGPLNDRSNSGLQQIVQSNNEYGSSSTSAGVLAPANEASPLPSLPSSPPPPAAPPTSLSALSPTQSKVLSRLKEVYNVTAQTSDNGNLHDVADGIHYLDALAGVLVEASTSPPSSAGGLVGPTASRLLVDQFLRLRDGDRFWFENSNEPLNRLIEVWYGTGDGITTPLSAQSSASSSPALTHFIATRGSLASLVNDTTTLDMKHGELTGKSALYTPKRGK